MDEVDKQIVEAFEGVVKGQGRIFFKVGYTPTPGNMEIHDAFKKFCYDRTNNEYLAGIGMLLQYAEIFTYLVHLDERIRVLESKVAGEVKPEVVEKKKEDNKVF